MVYLKSNLQISVKKIYILIYKWWYGYIHFTKSTLVMSWSYIFSGFKHNAVQMLYNTFTYSSIVLILLPNQYIGTGACVHKTCLGGKKMDRWKNGRTDRQMNRHAVIQEIEINRNEVWKIKKENSANIPIDVCMLRLIMLISHKLRVDLCLTMWNAFSH